MNILIVDDSVINQYIVQRCIERSSPVRHQYSFHANGQDALSMIERGGIDLLITDLNMPTMDGFELLRAMEATYLPRPGYILVMTSAIGDGLIEALKPYGVDGVLRKPLTVKTFTDALAHIHTKTPVHQCRNRGFDSATPPPASASGPRSALRPCSSQRAPTPRP